MLLFGVLSEAVSVLFFKKLGARKKCADDNRGRDTEERPETGIILVHCLLREYGKNCV
jgi:hypothetical protein